MVTFSSDTNPDIDIARSLGHRRADLLQPDPLRRWRGVRHHSAGGAGRRLRRGRRGRLLPRLQRALGQPLRRRRAGPAAAAQRRERALGLLPPGRPADPGLVGRHGGAALPARDRRHQRGPRPGGGGRPHARGRPTRRPGSTSSRSPSRTTRPAGGSSSRSTCSTAARRPTAARPSSSPRSSGPATCARPGRHPGRRPGLGRGPGHDDQLLPRRPARACPRWRWWPASCGRRRVSAPTTCRRPSSTTTSPPTSSTSSRSSASARKGEAKDFVRDGQHRARRRAADQHPRRPARRGLPARHERHRRRASPGPRHLGQPGRGARARRGHGRDRRADERTGARRRPLSPTLRDVPNRH